jgi:hypothetical protein
MRGVIIAAASLVGGCSTSAGIVPAGPDSYTLTKQVAPVPGSDTEAAKQALTEVTIFCEQKRLQFAPIDMGLVPSGLNPPSMYTVTFRCVASNDAPVPDPHRYSELIPGTSTRDEAVAKLGPPQGTNNVRGNIQLQWSAYNPVHPFRVAILFGPDGRMIKVTEVLDQ